MSDVRDVERASHVSAWPTRISQSGSSTLRRLRGLVLALVVLGAVGARVAAVPGRDVQHRAEGEEDPGQEPVLGLLLGQQQQARPDGEDRQGRPGAEVGVLDAVAPRVTAATFDVDAPAMRMAFTFSEALADALSVDTHPLLGRAKDLGSAAVMLLLLFTVAVWVGVAVSRFVMH